MNTTPMSGDYREWFEGIKRSVREAQAQAARSVNRELILIYWRIGRGILERQASEGWGARTIDRLSADLSATFPGMKGFSVRNLKYMKAFASAWSERQIVQCDLAQIPWSTHVALLDKVREPAEREWYVRAAVAQGWTRNILVHQIETRLHERQGKGAHNFRATMPPERAVLAATAFKDPYILDFVELAESANERRLEAALIERIRQFLLELGKGFAFLGSQYHLSVDGRDYYIDLLFYHTRLHSYVVVDLKLDEFKPEYAGKMSFYLSAVDAIVASERDERSIGLLLCRGKDGLVVEYALRSINSPIIVSNYTVLPAALREHLPSPSDLKRLDGSAHAMSAGTGLVAVDDTRLAAKTRAELARRVEAAILARGHSLPLGWAEALAVSADEVSLQAIIRDLDQTGDDILAFLRDHGIDWPEDRSR
ncbi:PDDEXK nuclease domain-containing protein [Methylobacterium sp. EM32]|uniref:PDDEXK nuclease domain-containing protein n=1 Tax=Methylobacterium sp. EM32 TaxID=3163481 RepID=UPI0033AA5F4D